jgi:hypothetical protein
LAQGHRAEIRNPRRRENRQSRSRLGSQRHAGSSKASETILKAADDVIGDKGFIGTDYITTPVRKPQDHELYMREHDYNNQIGSLHTSVERAVASLKTWRTLFTITGSR